MGLMHADWVLGLWLLPRQINRAKESDSLKKPLKVAFVGEEGVDEGGVQKEFFQLLVGMHAECYSSHVREVVGPKLLMARRRA